MKHRLAGLVIAASLVQGLLGQSLKQATADPPEGYKQCASENGSFTFNQKVDVAYGSNGHFVYKKGLTGKITFNNAQFGDPRPGYPKYGFYRLAAANDEVASSIGSDAKLPEGIRGKMHFRYKDQVTFSEELKEARIRAGDRIHVIPGQTISDDFLNRRMGESQGRTYFGKTGLKFDPKAPKICGRTFIVQSVDMNDRKIKFTEPFPENMSNDWNNSFAFEVIVVR